MVVKRTKFEICCFATEFFSWIFFVFANSLSWRSSTPRVYTFFLCPICATCVNLENGDHQILAYSCQLSMLVGRWTPNPRCRLNFAASWQQHSSHGTKRNSVCCLRSSHWRNFFHRWRQACCDLNIAGWTELWCDCEIGLFQTVCPDTDLLLWSNFSLDSF